MTQAKDKLTIQEVAQELGRSIEQVRRYVREGRLPAEKLGMQWFVERRDLEAFKGETASKSWKDVLARAREVRESIRNRIGEVDVNEWLDESRRSHP